MHQKHAKLTRPAYGVFHRNEWAIIGTLSGVIQDLSRYIIRQLGETYQIDYIDANHKYVDAAKTDTYQYRQGLVELDAVLVNGNDFKAKKQVVVIDPSEDASLKQNLDRLTDVALILLADGVDAPFSFIQQSVENIATIPIVALSDRAGILTFFETALKAATPPLYGLVLAGGKSQRMGTDKGAIVFHQKPQREHAADLLSGLCDQVFISCRTDQESTFASDFSLLTDSFYGLGPFGAILSAFRAYPNHAWLVIACDLPLLDKETLGQLIEGRNSSKIATAFKSPVHPFPEPLIAIWEPRSYPILLQFLAQGYSCPRKVLINGAVELIDAEKPEALMNVNRPEDRQEAESIIGSQSV